MNIPNEIVAFGIPITVEFTSSHNIGGLFGRYYSFYHLLKISSDPELKREIREEIFLELLLTVVKTNLNFELDERQHSSLGIGL